MFMAATTDIGIHISKIDYSQFAGECKRISNMKSGCENASMKDVGNGEKAYEVCEKAGSPIECKPLSQEDMNSQFKAQCEYIKKDSMCSQYAKSDVGNGQT